MPGFKFRIWCFYTIVKPIYFLLHFLHASYQSSVDYAYRCLFLNFLSTLTLNLSPLSRLYVFAYSRFRISLEVGQCQSSNIVLLQYCVGYLGSFTSLYKAYNNIDNNHMATYLDLDSYSTGSISQMVENWCLDIIEFSVHEYSISYYSFGWSLFMFSLWSFSHIFLCFQGFNFGCTNVSDIVIVLILQILKFVAGIYEAYWF